MRLVPINDFHSFVEDKFYEKHEISVEILHNPTVGTDNEKKVEAPKKKEEYVKEYAELLELEVSEIDPKLTIKELKQYIADEKKAKGII